MQLKRRHPNSGINVGSSASEHGSRGKVGYTGSGRRCGTSKAADIWRLFVVSVVTKQIWWECQNIIMCQLLNFLCGQI